MNLIVWVKNQPKHTHTKRGSCFILLLYANEFFFFYKIASQSLIAQMLINNSFVTLKNHDVASQLYERELSFAHLQYMYIAMPYSVRNIK